MRILSQSELHRSGLSSELPVDLSAQYFPIVLRAIVVQDGDHLLDYDKVTDLLKQAKGILDCEDLCAPERGSDRSKYLEEKYISTSRLIPQKGEFSVRSEFRTLNTLFPVDRLVFQDELQREKITATPGMLYFRAHFEFSGGRYASSGSLYLKEGCYDNSIRERSANRQSCYGRDEDKDTEAIARQKKWRGPVADLEQLTNARVVGKKVYGGKYRRSHNESIDLHQYVLETPFDFPPGFVHESVNIFTRRWAKISKAAKLFCELVTGSPIDTTESEGQLEKRGKNFPHGLSYHSGPDVAWQRCEKPWFVQTMLLARLIGGRYWHYALGFLETKMRNGDMNF